VALPNPGSVLKKYSTLVILGWAPAIKNMHQQLNKLMIVFMGIIL
jgi:hypothetical protein